MSTRDKGHQCIFNVASDNGKSFFELEEMTEISPSQSPQTEEVRTINRRGQRETDILSLDTTFEVTGIFGHENFAFGLVQDALRLNSEVYVQFFSDRDDMDSYQIMRCIVADQSQTHGAEGNATYTITFNIQDTPKFVGKQ